MADHPKSFWPDPDAVTAPADPAQQWVSALDHLGLRDEADIARMVVRAGIDLDTADRRELWELAAACNLDLIESVQDRDLRVQADSRPEYAEGYWTDTAAGEARAAAIRRVQERKKSRRRR